MPRKKFDEDGQIGRVLGGMTRAGFGDVVEELKREAEMEGKKLSEKLAEVIRIGMNYEKYSNLTLADAFKVLDFIQRLYTDLLYPTMVSASRITLEADIEKIRTIAEAMGYMHRDQAEALAEMRAREYLKNVLEKIEQEKIHDKEIPEERKGALTKFFERLAEVLAERLGEETIARIVSSGKLDSFVNSLTDVALQSITDTLMEEMAGGGEPPPVQENTPKGGEA